MGFFTLKSGAGGSVFSIPGSTPGLSRSAQELPGKAATGASQALQVRGIVTILHEHLGDAVVEPAGSPKTNNDI